MAKPKVKITAAALIRKEVSACIALSKAVAKIPRIKSILAEIEDASSAMDRAREARRKFQETK